MHNTVIGRGDSSPLGSHTETPGALLRHHVVSPTPPELGGQSPKRGTGAGPVLETVPPAGGPPAPWGPGPLQLYWGETNAHA